MHKDIPTIGCKGNKTLLLERKEHNRKDKWINNMEKELQELEEGSETIIHLESVRATLKKYRFGKTQGHDSIHGFLFKKFTTTHDILALELNRFLEETNIPEWMSKRKTTLI